MKRDVAALLDACVLVPMPLADTLLRLATGPGIYLPKWSDQIMVEVSRTLQERFGLSPEKAMYRENEIRRHFPEAWIEGYEGLIPAMTNHPKDRHVLAAAARAGVKVIVTYTSRISRPPPLRHILLRRKVHRPFSRLSIAQPHRS